MSRYHSCVNKPWQRALVLGLLLAVAVAGMFLFGYRAGRRARWIHRENEPIRAWMTVPFIAHAHHVSASTLFRAIGVQPREPRDRRSVRRLAHELHRPVPEVIAELQRAIDAAQPPGGRGQ